MTHWSQDHVKRTAQDLTKRTRREPLPRASIADVNLSFSDLKYFFECPYQFKMRFCTDLMHPFDEALGYGKSLHDMLAELHSRAIAGEKLLLQSPVNSSSDISERHLRTRHPSRDHASSGSKSRECVYNCAGQTDFDKIEFSEKAIEVALDDGVSVNGRIDLVRRRDTQEIAIVDLKSSERAQAEELTEAQLHIYALGYRELTGHDADFVETYELDSQTRRARAVDEEFISDVKDRIKSYS